IGHYNVQENPFFIENFERVVNMHIHDNNGEKDEHLALGKGKVDIKKFLNDYDGYLTIETREEKAILESLNYLKKIGVI
ncbi:MAG: sugar phosphate isomerase/epimerase, partial [Archaeoglobaceae archaeon]